MALQKNITLDNGINLPKAYIRIISINFITNAHIVINVGVYKNKTSRNDKKPEVIKFKHICTNEYNNYFDLNILNQENVNIVSQSYLWLKTLPFYSDTIDDMDLKE